MRFINFEKNYHNRLVREVNTLLGNYITINKNCLIEPIEQTYFPNSNLFSITDTNCIPISKLMFMDNGEQSYILTGAEQWERVLQNERLNLTIKNILEYLKLFYSTQNFPYNTQKIIESIDDMEFTEFPELKLFDDVNRKIQSPVVICSNNQFTIYCNITLEQSLYNAAFDITFDGKVMLIDKKLILQKIPIGELLVDL